MSDTARDFWNAEADAFDSEPDHGLLDPAVRAAWSQLLLEHVPPPPADILDLGCGTGTLSVLLAERGFRIHGADLAERMVALAGRKAERAGVEAHFLQADAAHPPFAEGSFDVVMSRHVLWAMQEPLACLRRWLALLRPEGRLLLVEGRWSTGSGLPLATCEELVRRVCDTVVVRRLDDPIYWGRDTGDERYLLTAWPGQPDASQ